MKAIAILFCVLLLTTTAVSQSRSRTTKSTKSETTAAAAAAQVRAEAATKVANQIKNLTAFLYLLGGVAKRIEELDAAAKSIQDAPTTTVQQNEQNKARLKSTFTDFRVGLDALEIYFRGTPGLQSYYLKLAGSAAGAATAENLASAGRYDQAGKSLLGVVNRLTDVLVIMP